MTNDKPVQDNEKTPANEDITPPERERNQPKKSIDKLADKNAPIKTTSKTKVAIADAIKPPKKAVKQKQATPPATIEKKGISKKGASTKSINSAPKEAILKVPVGKKAAAKPALKKAAPAKKEVTEKKADKEVEGADTTKTKVRKITFQVRFSTVAGQSLSVCGGHPLLGDNEPLKAFPLSYLNSQFWVGTILLPETAVLNKNIPYRYILKNFDDIIISEWGQDKLIELFEAGEILLLDYWNDSSLIENTFFTEPFQQVLLQQNFTEVKQTTPAKTTHIFRAKAPLLLKGQVLCISGSVAELGYWKKPLLLQATPGEVWHTISLDLTNANFPFLYKYGVYDQSNNEFLSFEDGNNRVLYESAGNDRLTVVSDGFAQIPANGFKGAGIAIPVFALRTENSFGVGEFTDLKLLTDWAKQSGLKLIQLLPVNDTTATHTFTDSYPYAAISAFALHPLYLNIPAILKNDSEAMVSAVSEKKAELNDKPEVDYVGVMAAKWHFIKQVFPAQKAATFEDADFKAFFEENSHWLVPYAAFSYFREKFNTSDFSTWPGNQTFDINEINAIAANPPSAIVEISIYYYVQYHLHRQLKEATVYAHENGIILKGDIPIGIYRNSCDAWQQPELYNMDMQAGAPPDDFAIKGQNWGFPTYNWKRMVDDGFTWWKKRFTQMSHYFDAFRIDHILGFFRIWSIPMNAVEGTMGHFVPAVPVHVNEIAGRGVNFSYERFCKPFINDSILSEFFGANADDVKATFLNRDAGDLYSLKEAYDSQRKVEAYFLTQGGEQDDIKQGLYNLISNVILFEEANSNKEQFHFRISMNNTSSYRYLDSHTRLVLYDLYINYFFRRQDDFWRREGMQKLPELKRSTNMLICGEDLGMVPSCVPGVMRQLAILSLEIQRMPKDPAREFFHPNDAPYLSVVTPSTHDMSTIRGWWEENRAATQRFFNSELGQWGTAPYFCEPWINRIILLQHFYSPAMWSIFQLQDLLGMSGKLRRENPNDERINIPADPKHYWRYRMHITLEALMQETEFNAEIRGFVTQSGRLP